MPVLKFFGLLRVVVHIQGSDAYRVLFQERDPQSVRRYYKAAIKEHGCGKVAIVNRDGYQMYVRLGRSRRMTYYTAERRYDVTDKGKMIPTLLRVVGEPSQDC